MSNKTQTTVSIIIAAYNSEKYIAQSIESAINQTYADIEIIIVNDGSTDNTVQIAESYAQKDERIVIFTQPNKGVSAARNAGFAIAKGEYFCIVDADDIMLPSKVELQLHFLQAHPSADFAYSKVYYFIDGTDAIYRHDLATVSGAPVYKKLLQYGNFIYTSTVFFRRSVFDQFGGFDERLLSAEEFDYWLSLSQSGVIFLHQDAYLTLCRSRSNGLTSDSVTMYSTAVAVLEKHMAYSKLFSYQYIKSSILLFVSKLRKTKSKTGNQGVSEGGRNFLRLSYYVNHGYGLLKRIKFSMTFKKVRDTKLKEYLLMIESRKNI